MAKTHREARICRFCPPVIQPGARWASFRPFLSAADRIAHEKRSHPVAFKDAAKVAKEARR